MGEGWGCPRPLSRLSRTEGWAVGIRHLIHSLSPPTSSGQAGGSSPPGLSGWRRRMTPFLEELRVFPFRPAAPSSESAFLTVCATWVPPRGVGPQWVRWAGWPSVPPGGAGQLHRDFSSQTDRLGLQVPSQPSTRSLWGRQRSRDGPRPLLRTNLPRVLVPWRRPGSPTTFFCPGHRPAHPSSVAPAFLLGNATRWEAWPASWRWRRWGRGERRPCWASWPARGPGPGVSCAHLVLAEAERSGGGHLPFQSSSER